MVRRLSSFPPPGYAMGSILKLNYLKTLINQLNGLIYIDPKIRGGHRLGSFPEPGKACFKLQSKRWDMITFGLLA